MADDEGWYRNAYIQERARLYMFSLNLGLSDFSESLKPKIELYKKHNIYPILREAIREVVTNEPTRPLAFLRDHFAS